MTAYRSYEDYDTSSNHYDGARAAIGIEIALGVMAATGPGLARQSALDVGCGTGNYLQALRPHVGAMIGLEYSAGMLRQSQKKVHGHDNQALVRGSAFALPFADESFDAVMFNQVVHHFDDGGDGVADFPLLEGALRESFRVLRPGGAVLLNHAGQRQIRDGYWWMELIPGAMQRMCRRYISIAGMEQMLTGLGFTATGTAVPLGDVLQARDYLNLRGPLDESWRRTDSTWTLAEDDELRAGLDRLRAMLDAGTAESWLEEREALRRDVGQTVYIWARRPR